MKKSRTEIFELEDYDSRGVSIMTLAEEGELRVSLAVFGPRGTIGAHPTGAAQLFHVVSGRGWVSGRDGDRAPIVAGEHVVWEMGEMHASGSHRGMTAVIVQSEDPEMFRAPG